MRERHYIVRMGWGWMLFQAFTGLLPAANPAPALRSERIFIEARAAWQTAPTNCVAAWHFARACFDRVEHATNTAQKIEFAKQGIAAARAALASGPGLAAAHYYLAMNVGQLASATRNLGGLKLVAEMEREFKIARDLDASFDFAGPDRSLGLLYRDAPGWPISVGNRTKARQHLERACELARTYPDNRLNLLEAWLKWGDRKKALAELQAVETALGEARQKLTGEEWVGAWADWDARWHAIQLKASEVPLRPAVSPKGAR